MDKKRDGYGAGWQSICTPAGQWAPQGKERTATTVLPVCIWTASRRRIRHAF
ncbi:MAG: hypothetical protein HFI44_13115 [Lachnospiraceae bacterium]|nr:hypothetical protein [Lachnospiraceae bacterium]